MAKDKLTQYDSTASNNTDVGGISVAEGMLPSGVNNAIREQMSHLADFAAGTSGVDVLKLQDDTDTNSIKLQAPASVTADTTFTLPDGDGSADQVLKTDGSGQLGWADRHANPSLIINGAMKVAQRGTTSTNVSGITTVDRWHTQFAGGGITDTQESLSSSDTPYSLGFRNYLRMNNDTSTSGAGDVRQIYQIIEAQNIANSGWNYTSASSYITLSLWVRTSLAGKYRFGLTSDDGTAQMFNFTETLVANTWTKITKTIPGNSNLTFNNDNGSGLLVVASLWFGTNYTDATTVLDAWTANDATKNAPTDIADWGGTSNATFDITGVKLEVGSTATDFVHRSYGEELALCQRYLHRIGGSAYTRTAAGFSYAASAHNTPIPVPVAMRAIPSLTTSDLTGGSTFVVYHSGGSLAAVSAIVIETAGSHQNSVLSINSTASGLTAGNVGILVTNNNSDAFLQFDAEL